MRSQFFYNPMDKTYTIIPDFMLDYDLTLSETVALAVIYGFSQDGKSSFKGSYNYLARKCKLQRRQTIYVLEKLIDKGLVTKEVYEKNGVLSCSFRTTLSSAENAHPVQIMHGGSANNALGGSVKNAPNNIDNKINRNKRESVFTPPTLDEVRAFWRERPSMTSDPDHFYLYFDEADWKYKGERKMKDWHKAALMWEKNEKKYGR